jgi:hypothetical protein
MAYVLSEHWGEVILRIQGAEKKGSMLRRLVEGPGHAQMLHGVPSWDLLTSGLASALVVSDTRSPTMMLIVLFGGCHSAVGFVYRASVADRSTLGHCR